MNFEPPVFIVDDDEGVCRLLAGALKKEGLTSEWKTSGTEAIDWLRENDASLLLLDLRLSDMGGKEVIEALEKEGRSFPFIVISGVADIRVAVELMKDGALDFLPKDTQLLQLVAPLVTRSLARLEEQRRLAESEGRFIQLANNIQSVFWISTPDMTKFVYVSPAYERMWGATVTSLYENPDSWLNAVVPADLPVLRSALERLKGAVETVEVEFRIGRADGGQRWLHCTASRLNGRAGTGAQLTGFIRDVTERKEIDRRLIEAGERERRRLGQDLHDDLCQRLAAIKLRCGLLERDLARHGFEDAAVAGELGSAVGEATSLARNLARGLSPVSLDTEGLPSALDTLTRSTSSIFGIPVSLECAHEIRTPNADTATHLYRIAQELISNAAKHAGPTRIGVKIYTLPGGLVLEVESDGTPFEPSGTEGDGMGLHHLRSRANAIGANLAFLPGPPPDGGTRVLCNLPITPVSIP
jgi:PAS domain S-box-containing protein